MESRATGKPLPTFTPGSHAGLTPALTPILGREDETSQVLSLLDRATVRVVTLLGPGGVGKTRLAQEIAGTIGPQFAHGVCFVPLASIRDPDLVSKATDQSLGLQESGDHTAAVSCANRNGIS